MFLFTPRMEEKYPDGKGYKGVSFGPQHSGQIDIAAADSNLLSKCFNKMEKLEFNEYENREFQIVSSADSGILQRHVSANKLEAYEDFL